MSHSDRLRQLAADACPSTPHDETACRVYAAVKEAYRMGRNHEVWRRAREDHERRQRDLPDGPQ